ncbi:MAG: hypothetical protein ACI9J3_000234 [Parvicellaceae bacterium]|jgi:hypothetical protein
MGAFFKKNYVHFIAIAIFFIIASVFYAPAMKGFIPKMHDITTHRSSSKEIKDLKDVYGENSYWTSRVFSGMPSYQISADYPRSPQTYLYKAATLWLPYPVNFLFLLFVSLYILLMCLKVDPWIAIAGCVGFGLCSHFINIMGAGHTSKTHAMAYIPAIVGAFYMVLTSAKYVRYGILLTLLLTLQLFANHYQITYYTFILLLFVGGFQFTKSGRLLLMTIGLLSRKESKVKFEISRLSANFKRQLVLVFAAAIAFGANSPSILMTSDFAKNTIRGKSELTIGTDGKALDASDFNKTDGLDRSYITEYSYDKGELLGYMIPNSIEVPSEDQQEFMESLSRKNPQEYQALVNAYQANSGKLDRNRGVFLSGYFGDQTSARPHYLGALFVFLALLGLIFAKGWVKWGLFSASILAIMLSLGQNLGGSLQDMWFTNLWIDYVPMYNKFRAVKMILIIAEISVPVLAMLGLHQILKDREAANKKKTVFFVVSGIFLVFMIANVVKPDFIASFYSSNEVTVINGYGTDLLDTNPTESAAFESAIEKVKDMRVAGYSSDAMRAIIFVILGILILVLYFMKVIKRIVVIPLLSLFLFIDVVSVANRFTNNDLQPKEYFRAHPKDKKTNPYQAWQPREDLYNRAVKMSPADEQILEAEKGNIPNFTQKNKEILDVLKSKGLIKGKEDRNNVQFTTLNFNSNYRVLGLTNPFNDGETPFFHKSTTGYNAAKLKKFQEIIEFRLGTELGQLQDPTATKVVNMLNTRYLIAQDKSQMFKNPFAFGNAWFVTGFHKVKDANEEIMAINDVDVHELAIIQEKYTGGDFSETIVPDPNATVTQRTLDYRPNHLTYDFEAKSDQFVVFSEIYYPDGWNAYVDGNPADHVGVNYILRGMNVPKGKHLIEFKFEPSKVSNLSTLAMICLTVVFLLLFAWIFIIYKDLKKPTPAA